MNIVLELKVKLLYLYPYGGIVLLCWQMGRIEKKRNPFLGNLAYFFKNFAKKHRLSVRDQRDDSEVWYVYASFLRITLASLGLLVVMFGAVVLLVIYTPVLDNLPGNPGEKSRAMLVENIMRLDSLERELSVMQVYNDNVRLVMEGKTPVVRPMKRQQDIDKDKELVPANAADSLLRAQMEVIGGRYSLVTTPVEITVHNRVRGMGFTAPVSGTVVNPFNPNSKLYGVGISVPESKQVVAAQDGTVVMSYWSPDDEYVIQIQHKDNFISIYKRATQLLKSVGDKVETGEVVAYIDRDVQPLSDDMDDQFVFELWYDGQPIDPQSYILFE